MIKHYLITRYNIGLYYKKKHPQTKWMDNRLRLFRTYTVPSIRAQTNQDFEWVILLDKKTPDNDCNKIKSSLKGLNCCFIKADYNVKFKEKDCEHGWGKELRAKMRGECAFALMTRIDNDDAFNVTYLEKTRNAAEKNAPVCLVDSPNGYVYDEKTGKTYFGRDASGSPFISLMVPTKKSMETIYSTYHRGMATRFYRKRVNMPKHYRGWLMVVHGNNKSNSTNGRYVFGETSVVMKDFGVAL